MSKSQYPYPPDEFDVRGPEGAPVGVHREPRSGWSSVWPFLLVAVVFGGLAVGVTWYLSEDSGPNENPPAASEESVAPEGEGDGSETSEGEGEGSEGDGEGSEGEGEGSEGEGDSTEEPSDEPSDEPTELPGDPAIADLTARVVVYNAITTGGAAGQAGAAQSIVVNDAGFSDVGALDADDDLKAAYEDTTILYADGRADTASAVAESLGVTGANMELSDDLTNSATDAVWVVLKEPVG